MISSEFSKSCRLRERSLGFLQHRSARVGSAKIASHDNDFSPDRFERFFA
jgi:hypothetical protein